METNTGDISIPQPSPEDHLRNLSQAFSMYQSGGMVNHEEIARSLTVVYKNLEPQQLKDPDIVKYFLEFGPLTKDPTGRSAVTDVKLLKLMFPDKKPGRHSLKKKLLLTTAALGTAAVLGGGAILAKEVADLQSSGGPKPVSYDKTKLFPNKNTPRIEPIPKPPPPGLTTSTETSPIDSETSESSPQLPKP